jgi:hypothetical protein
MLSKGRFESFCHYPEKLRCIKGVACVVGEVSGDSYTASTALRSLSDWELGSNEE